MEQRGNIVKVNNKGTGTTSMTSFQRLRVCFEQ